MQDSMQPRVTLEQGIVVGRLHNEDALKKPVQSFRGIPYALPPTGERRFRRPERVPPSTTIIDASKYGPAAPGKPLLMIGPKLTYSEDCLTANVFRQIPQEDDKLLPVMVYIHGGAFNRGSSSMHNTLSMVSWSEQKFVAVSFNYRLGSLGFLPSRLGAKEGILNLGLHDQILLFQWVQDNIEAFGGDKHNITLAGLSAGAHSIGHHIMRHSKTNPGPFHRAIIESGAPTSRAVRRFDAEIHEQQFKEFLREVNCPPDLTEDQILPFLRSLDLETISNAQNFVFDKYNPSLRWAFQPVIDGELIPRAPIESWRSGDYYQIPIMTGFNGNEGSLYVDKQMSTDEQFTDFFSTLLPTLPAEDITKLHTLYPSPNTSQTYQSTNDIPDIGPQYPRVEAAYGQYAYVAPVRQTAHLASTRQSAPIYLYHWAPKTSVVGGASHGDNMRYETLDPAVTSLSKTQAELAGTLHAYVTSFICNDGDPNALKGPFQARPEWTPYTAQSPRTMIFGKDNRELIGGGVGVTAQMVEDEWAREQCGFWWERVEVTQQ